jgi:hypothetical protein
VRRAFLGFVFIAAGAGSMACTAILGLRTDYALEDAAADGNADASADAHAPITFVQIGKAAANPGSSVMVPMDTAQNAGDLVVIAVGWQFVAATPDVTDSAGNQYSIVAPALTQNTVSQAIYWATVKASSAGANTVSVVMGTSVQYLDVRVVEFSGVSTPDGLAPSQGNSSTPNAGLAKSTIAADELLVAAGMATNVFSGAGPDYKLEIATQFSNLLEDRVVHEAGVYTASAPLIANADWVFQLVTFR